MLITTKRDSVPTGRGSRGCNDHSRNSWGCGERAGGGGRAEQVGSDQECRATRGWTPGAGDWPERFAELHSGVRWDDLWQWWRALALSFQSLLFWGSFQGSCFPRLAQ